jgi:tight adherence protein B
MGFLMSFLVGLLVLAAMFVGFGPSARARLARLRPPSDSQARARRAPWPWEAAMPLLLAGVGWIVAGSAGLTAGLSVGLVAATGWGLWRGFRRRRASERSAAEVVDACRLLAGLLRVGHVPVLAVRLAATDAPVLAEVVSVQQVGGSIPAALRRGSDRPGARGLAELAAAWEVAERTGASLTATLDALTERLSAEQKLARTVSAELSAPRASGRVLAVLPVAGIGLGYAIGGDPLHFLVTTLVGQACLVGGVGLACAGVWWIERIATVTR